MEIEYSGTCENKLTPPPPFSPKNKKNKAKI